MVSWDIILIGLLLDISLLQLEFNITFYLVVPYGRLLTLLSLLGAYTRRLWREKDSEIVPTNNQERG